MQRDPIKGLHATTNSIDPIHISFTGKDPEPRPSLSSGHMPNSLSLPFSECVKQCSGASSTFTELRPQVDLEELLGKALKADLDRVRSNQVGVVNSCGSGMTAAVLWLALQELGINSAIYDEAS